MSQDQTHRHSHIVPRCYLRGWADASDKIELTVSGGVTHRLISTRDAGVRKNIYRLTGPSGDRIDDIDPLLGLVEDKAAPILRDIRNAWPLTQATKTILAELFGRQYVRGTRWMDWHAERTEIWLAEAEAAGVAGVPTDLVQEHLPGARDLIRSDSTLMERMLSLGSKVMAAFGAMHWTIVEFAADVIATSDHPVVVWPINAGSLAPAAISPDYGVLPTLEVRIPLTSRDVLLMTWADIADTVPARIAGGRDHARTINAFTIAQARPQWFNRPAAVTPAAPGSRLTPISPLLVPNYGFATAEHSPRRAWAKQYLDRHMGQEFPGERMELMWLTPRAPAQ